MRDNNEEKRSKSGRSTGIASFDDANRFSRWLDRRSGEKGLTVILLYAGLCDQRMNWKGLSGIRLKRYCRVCAVAPLDSSTFGFTHIHIIDRLDWMDVGEGPTV
jgi:hypothetical protein